MSAPTVVFHLLQTIAPEDVLSGVGLKVRKRANAAEPSSKSREFCGANIQYQRKGVYELASAPSYSYRSM